MFRNIKKKIEDYIIDEAFKIMRGRHSSVSAAVKYAETEMNAGINGDRRYDTPNLGFMERFPDLVAAVSEFCEKHTDECSDADTGVRKTAEMIWKCVSHEPVFPLTFDNHEFAYVTGSESDIKRNLRFPSVGMTPDGRYVYSDAINPVYSFDVKPVNPNKKRSRLEFVRNRCAYGSSAGSYSDIKPNDGIYAVAGDGQLYLFTKDDIRILNKVEFDPDVKFDIDTYIITYPDLYRLVFVKLEDLSAASEVYDILVKSCQESVDILNKEIEEHCSLSDKPDELKKETERRVEWVIKNLAKVQPKPEMK